MLEVKAERLAGWAGGRPQGPVTIELNPTNRCNLKCPSCWLRFFPADTRRELGAERLARLVDEAAELEVREFRIPGSGEPFVRKDMPGLMARIKDRGMNGLVITNGLLVGERLAAELVEMKWDCVTVSMDSARPETDDWLRGRKGAHEKIVSALGALRALKRKARSRLPVLRVNTVLTNRNHKDILALFRLASRLGVEDVQVQPLTVWGGDGAELELDAGQRGEFEKTIPRIEEFARKRGIFTNVSSWKGEKIVEDAARSMDRRIKAETGGKDEKNPFLKSPCFEPWYNLIVMPDGSVGPCSMSGGKDGGSVADRSLRDVWLGPELTEVRRSLLVGDLKPYCRRCCAVVFVENRRLRTALRERMRRPCSNANPFVI